MTVFQYVGNTAPSLPDTIKQTVNGVTTPVDLAGGSVNFRMRSLFGSALLIDSPAVIVTPALGTVRYDWTLADTTTAIGSSPGPYVGYWYVTLGSQVVQTPEFDIEFLSNTTLLRTVGPCTDWIGTQDVTACFTDIAEGACLTSAVRSASEVLYEMSGHIFGGHCQSTIRPCSMTGCFPGIQILSRGHIVWNGFGWDGMGDPCQCGGWLSQVQLPGVAQSVVSVMINGDTLSPDAYRLDPNNFLVRVDGGAWPVCQNMAAGPDDPGSFQIIYAHSYQPPELGRRAAVELAREFFLVCAGQACSLPTGAYEVVRQGIRIRRNADLWTSGATGLPAVDSFLAAYGCKPGFLVMSPEVTSPSRRMFP